MLSEVWNGENFRFHIRTFKWLSGSLRRKEGWSGHVGGGQLGGSLHSGIQAFKTSICYSKWGTWKCKVNITWEIVRNAEFYVPSPNDWIRSCICEMYLQVTDMCFKVEKHDFRGQLGLSLKMNNLRRIRNLEDEILGRICKYLSSFKKLSTSLCVYDVGLCWA